MNTHYRVDRRGNDEVTKRTPHDIDRFEDEGGPGPEDIRHQRRENPSEVAQPKVPLSVACPRCDGKEIGGKSAEGARASADPSQVIVTAGATADSAQVHHRGIPELQSHGESPGSATVNLAQDLAREIDGAADDLHREPLERALDDVKAYIEGIS